MRNHQARCICPPQYLGDPYQICRKPECLIDDDCPQVLACRNEHCVDPCACAVNANCIVRSHAARCQCIPGYIGDPYNTGCYPSELNPLFLFDLKNKLKVKVQSTIFIAVISFGRGLVLSPKIVINLPRTYKKLNCKGEPYWFSG